MSKKKQGRGRPALYTGNLQRHIQGLVRKFGVGGARTILSAPVGSAAAAARNKALVPNPLGISVPTLYKLAKLGGVAIPKRGKTAPVPS